MSLVPPPPPAAAAITTGTRLLAGIDEAGLGPLVGPLALGWSVLSVPPGAPDAWKLLKKRVSRNPAHDRKRLVVADSKKVFARNPRGRRRLEETALSFLTLLRADRRPPRAAADVLFGDLRPDPALLARHPWYELLADVPRELGADAVELRASVLAREMEHAGCSLVDAGVRIVPAGELNASYRETDSKALTLWMRTVEVLRRLWRLYGVAAPHVTVDLQGGRLNYGPLLARAFPDASVQLVRRAALLAEYRLEERSAFSCGPGRAMDLCFVARGEDRSFSVALASCLAKYARETVMDAFNAWFLRLQPDLRPTAGYRTDARRWLDDAAGLLARAGLDPGVLVRDR